MTQISKVILGALLTLTIFAFVGQVAVAGGSCCASRTKAKAARCAKVSGPSSASVKATGATADVGKKLDREECVARCMAQGMSRKEAEACVAKMTKSLTRKPCRPEDCIARCMALGMSRKEAEACVSKMIKGQASVGFHPAKAKGCQVGDRESYTKEECLSYLMAAGMTKEEAEAKYAACAVDGRCSGKRCARRIPSSVTMRSGR